MRKIITFIFCFNLFGLFNACECPPERYFDYTSIGLFALNPHVDQNEILTLNCEYQNIYYLTQKSFCSPFVNSAYATSVCEKGYDGEKYLKSSISVTSDSDFSDLYPAGSDLGAIIKIFGTSPDGHRVQKYINEFLPQDTELGFMTIEARPEIDNSHILTIVIEKSNGEILSAVSPEIVWE